MKLSLDEWLTLTSRMHAQNEEIIKLRREVREGNARVAEMQVIAKKQERVIHAAITEGYNPATGKFDAGFTQEKNDDSA